MEPILGDSFGEALLARYEGRPAVIVIERDDGFAEIDASTDYFADAEADPHWAWIAARATGRVLDLGAGAGRAALALQRAGHDVVALDVSPAAVAICRRRGIRDTFEGTVVDFAAADPRPEPFDAFVAIGNNLGLLGSRADAGPFLDALRALARPGARLVGTMLDPYRTDDPDHLAYHEANRAAGRLGGEIRIRVRHRRTATDWFGLLWASADELGAVVAAHGWAVTDVVSGPGALYAAELVPR